MDFNKSVISKFKKGKGLLIDVRSPDEYYKGHMPNSINIPLFNNEERSFIGKKYKNAGRRKAVLEGLKIVESKIDTLIKDLIDAHKYNSEINKNEKEELINLKIYCSRGGMRSQSISWLLNKLNFKNIILAGGYKSYRRWVLDNFTKEINMTLIGGKTGTGKTKILIKMQELNHQVIDLESLASHRGSAFGGLGMGIQPTNEQFENLLAEQLLKFDLKKSVYIEAESGNIGKCRIPFEFFNQMKIAERIEIVKDESERINELIKTYSIYSKNELKNAVNKISRRLGPQRTKKAIEAIDLEDWKEVCHSVLEYYDKCYEHERNKKLKLIQLDLTNKSDSQIIDEIINNSTT